MSGEDDFAADFRDDSDNEVDGVDESDKDNGVASSVATPPPAASSVSHSASTKQSATPGAEDEGSSSSEEEEEEDDEAVDESEDVHDQLGLNDTDATMMSAPAVESKTDCELPETLRGFLARLESDPRHLALLKASSSLSETERADALISLRASTSLSNVPLIASCNASLSRLRLAIEGLHRSLCASYKSCFSELESLVPDALEYAKVVLAYSETPNPSLEDILSGPRALVVKLSRSSSPEKPAASRPHWVDWSRRILRLEEDSQSILKLVESEMREEAPNLCALCGPRAASLLVGLAGGLDALKQMPSCNVQVMGRKRGQRAQGVLASSAQSRGVTRHAGVLAQECELVLSAPPKFRRRLIRVLSGRVVLCARIDADGRKRGNDRAGAQWRAEIERKLEKWADPGPGKLKKPLAIPGAQRKKKRGGQRSRKLKEMMKQSEAMKLLNRTAMTGSGDAYDRDAMGTDSGMLLAASHTARGVDLARSSQNGADTKRLIGLVSRKRGLEGDNAATGKRAQLDLVEDFGMSFPAAQRGT